jgi:hypothetical protein
MASLIVLTVIRLTNGRLKVGGISSVVEHLQGSEFDPPSFGKEDTLNIYTCLCSYAEFTKTIVK